MDKLFEIRINSFNKEGNGVGQCCSNENQRTSYEVPFTIPGDKVETTLSKKGKKKGLKQARLDSIIEPSPQRIDHRCKHFASCGGCRWQMLPYEEQLKEKERQIHDLFKDLVEEQTEMHSIIPCDNPWYYRNKMEFSFSQDSKGHRYLGLFLTGTRGHVLNIEECYLCPPWFVKALEAAKEWWNASGLDAFNYRNDQGSLRNLILREGVRTGDRLVMLNVSGNPDFALHKQQLDSFKEIMIKNISPESPDHRLAIFLRIQQAKKGYPTQFYEMQLYGEDHLREELHIEQIHEKKESLLFKVSPSAFFQPNTIQAEKIYSSAFRLLGDILSKETRLFDLFCGTATLGIIAASKVKEVISVDLSPEAIVDARENIKLNRLDNIQAIQGDVGEVLERFQSDQKQQTVIMIDPPRAGLSEKALHHLIRLNPEYIVYISCNPSTQAENAMYLKQHGYQIKAIQPIDQFPQTIHVENIILFAR